MVCPYLTSTSPQQYSPAVYLIYPVKSTGIPIGKWWYVHGYVRMPFQKWTSIGMRIFQYLPMVGKKWQCWNLKNTVAIITLVEDDVDLDVCCSRKVVKLTHSLARSLAHTFGDTNSLSPNYVTIEVNIFTLKSNINGQFVRIFSIQNEQTSRRDNHNYFAYMKLETR